ncbi:trehalose operon repressor, partial [Enterococcus faecalis]
KQLIGEVEGNHVVVVRSIMNLEDTRCFGYTESRHRLNKFKFVEFARRRKL